MWLIEGREPDLLFAKQFLFSDYLGGTYKSGLLPEKKRFDFTGLLLLLLVFLARSYMSSTMPAPLVCRTIAEDREDAVTTTHCMGLEELPSKTLAGLTAIFFGKLLEDY